MTFLIEKGDISYFYRASLEAIKFNVADDLLYPFAVVRRMIFMFIPSDWSLGLKPEGIAAMFSDELQAGDEYRRGNMPPGFIGLFVLSFGAFVSFFILPFYILFLYFLDGACEKRNGVVRDGLLANVFVISLFILRGDEDSLYFLVFNLFVLKFMILVFYFIGNVSGRKHA